MCGHSNLSSFFIHGPGAGPQKAGDDYPVVPVRVKASKSRRRGRWADGVCLDACSVFLIKQIFNRTLTAV